MAAAGTTNADEVLHVRVILCASSSHTDKVMHYGTAGDGIVMRGSHVSNLLRWERSTCGEGLLCSLFMFATSAAYAIELIRCYQGA